MIVFFNSLISVLWLFICILPYAYADTIYTFAPINNSLYLCNITHCNVQSQIDIPFNWTVLNINSNPDLDSNNTLYKYQNIDRLGVWPISSTNNEYDGITIQIATLNTSSLLYLGSSINGYLTTPGSYPGLGLDIQLKSLPGSGPGSNTRQVVTLIWPKNNITTFTYALYSPDLLTWFPDVYTLYSEWNSMLAIYLGKFTYPMSDIYHPTRIHVPVPRTTNQPLSIYDVTQHLNNLLYQPDNNNAYISTLLATFNLSSTTMFPLETILLESIAFYRSPAILPLNTSIIFDIQLNQKWFLNNLQLQNNNTVFNYPFWKNVYQVNQSNQFIEAELYIQFLYQACYWILGIDGLVVNMPTDAYSWNFPSTIWDQSSSIGSSLVGPSQLLLLTRVLNTSIQATNSAINDNPQIAKIYEYPSNGLTTTSVVVSFLASTKQSNDTCIVVKNLEQIYLTNTLNACIIYQTSVNLNAVTVNSMIEFKHSLITVIDNTIVENIYNNNIINNTNSILWWDLLPILPYNLFIHKITTHPYSTQSITPAIQTFHASWSFNDNSNPNPIYWFFYSNESSVSITINFYGPPKSILLWDINSDTINNYCLSTSVNIPNHATLIHNDDGDLDTRIIWKCTLASKQPLVFHFTPDVNETVSKILPIELINKSPSYNNPVWMSNTLYEWTFYNNTWWIISNLILYNSNQCPIEYLTDCKTTRYGIYAIEPNTLSFNSQSSFYYIAIQQNNYYYYYAPNVLVELRVNHTVSIVSSFQNKTLANGDNIWYTTFSYYNYHTLINSGNNGGIVQVYINNTWQYDFASSIYTKSMFVNLEALQYAQHIQWLHRLASATIITATANRSLILDLSDSSAWLDYTNQLSNWNIYSLYLANTSILFNALNQLTYQQPNTYYNVPLGSTTSTSTQFNIVKNILQLHILGIIPSTDSCSIINYNRYGIQYYRSNCLQFINTTNINYNNRQHDTIFSNSISSNTSLVWNTSRIQTQTNNLYPLLVNGHPNLGYLNIDGMGLGLSSNATKYNAWLSCFGDYTRACAGNNIIVNQNDGQRWSSFRYYSNVNYDQHIVYTLANRSPGQSLYVSIFIQDNVFIDLVPTIAYGNYSCQTLSFTCIAGYENTFTCLLQPKTILLLISPLALNYSILANQFNQNVTLPVFSTINSCSDVPITSSSSTKSSSGVSSSLSSIIHSSSISSSIGIISSSIITSSSSSTSVSSLNNNTISTDPWIYTNYPTKSTNELITKQTTGIILASTMVFGMIIGGLFYIVL